MAAAQSHNDLTVLPSRALLVGRDAVTTLTKPTAGKRDGRANPEGEKEPAKPFGLCQHARESALTLCSIILAHEQPLYLSLS